MADALRSALAADDVVQLEAAAEDGIDLATIEVNSCTILGLAAQKDAVRSVRFLLAHPGVDPNRGRLGTSPLCIAASKGALRTVQVLTSDRRVDVNGARRDGVTPLIMAVQQGFEPIVRVLLAHPRIDPNLRTLYPLRITALHVAMRTNALSLVHVLLDEARGLTFANNLFQREGPVALADGLGCDAVVKRMLQDFETAGAVQPREAYGLPQLGPVRPLLLDDEFGATGAPAASPSAASLEDLAAQPLPVPEDLPGPPHTAAPSSHGAAKGTTTAAALREARGPDRSAGAAVATAPSPATAAPGPAATATSTATGASASEAQAPPGDGKDRAFPGDDADMRDMKERRLYDALHTPRTPHSQPSPHQQGSAAGAPASPVVGSWRAPRVLGLRPGTPPRMSLGPAATRKPQQQASPWLPSATQSVDLYRKQHRHENDPSAEEGAPSQAAPAPDSPSEQSASPGKPATPPFPAGTALASMAQQLAEAQAAVREERRRREEAEARAARAEEELRALREAVRGMVAGVHEVSVAARFDRDGE